MLSLLGVLCIFVGAAITPGWPMLGVTVFLVGAALGVVAYHRPGDMEWMLGLFVAAGIAWTVIQFGSVLGLWGL